MRLLIASPEYYSGRAADTAASKILCHAYHRLLPVLFFDAARRSTWQYSLPCRQPTVRLSSHARRPSTLRSLRPPMRKAVRLIVAGRPCGEVVIDLSQEEQRLFHVLLQAAQLAERRTTVRIAGGWVRDKLLGRTSHDIDVTLDNCTGRDFAEAVNSFLRAHGEKTSTIGVIAANPEQSKHLETATCRVLDHWIDFVHLRTEVYEPGSRIPRVTFGTALQVRCVPAKAAIARASMRQVVPFATVALLRHPFPTLRCLRMRSAVTSP